MVLSPRESARFIACNSSRVKINEKGIQELGNVIIEAIEDGRLSVDNFSQTTVHPKREDPWALDWLFVVDTLNFCFWHNQDEPGWMVEGYTGYFALCAAINRAIKEKVDILNPKFYSQMSKKDLLNVLRSDNGVPIPLIQERIECLCEVGTVLMETYDSSFQNVVRKADNSAVKLLQTIVSSFKCFKDEAEFKGTRVGIYKRAQILIGDIWTCFKNQGVGHFDDIDEITMFADYRVPQSLLYFGVFEYDEDLSKQLDDNQILSNGAEDEVAIRGCSIHAVELVKKYAQGRLDANKELNSILIDHFLWDFRRKHNDEIEKKKLPFHKTFSIYY